MKNNLRVILIILCTLLYYTTDKIFFSKDAASGTVTFSLTAATSLFTETGSKPFILYNATFTSNNSGNAKPKVPFKVKSHPVTTAPDFAVQNFSL